MRKKKKTLTQLLVEVQWVFIHKREENVI